MTTTSAVGLNARTRCELSVTAPCPASAAVRHYGSSWFSVASPSDHKGCRLRREAYQKMCGTSAVRWRVADPRRWQPVKDLGEQLTATFSNHAVLGRNTINITGAHLASSWKPSPKCPTPKLMALLVGEYRTFDKTKANMRRTLHKSSSLRSVQRHSHTPCTGLSSASSRSCERRIGKSRCCSTYRSTKSSHR